VVDGHALRLTLYPDTDLPCIDEYNWLRRLRGFVPTCTVRRIEFVVTVTTTVDSDMQDAPGDATNAANNDGADTEANQVVEANELLLPVQQVRDMAELKVALRAMRQTEESKKLVGLN
jgi:hypothetical protein